MQAVLLALMSLLSALINLFSNRPTQVNPAPPRDDETGDHFEALDELDPTGFAARRRRRFGDARRLPPDQAPKAD